MEHKHVLAVRYIPEVLLKTNQKRWIVVDYCTLPGCGYERTRAVTYEQPEEENNAN